MDQENITQIYETLAPMAGQYANAQAEQIGQAQQSMGPLAAATMGQSQTSGLGNYTYNRLMRPQVDVMRDEILVEGYRNRLNRALSDAYNTARKNYNRRAGGGGGGNNTPNTPSGTNLDTTKEYTDESAATPTQWTILPNSFKMENEKGEMVAINRGPLSDEDWLKVYNDRKKFAAANGRKFEG